MSAYNWRKGGLRGGNMIAANPQRMEGPLDAWGGYRYATGRNVKGESNTPGHYVAVEVWTLKEKVNGKAVTVTTHATREDAVAWVRGD